MLEILQDAIIDTIRLVPFLFITYLIMEYIENKTSNKIRENIKKSGKFGPLIGGIVRDFATMWIFGFCNFVFIKIDINRNINCGVFVNIR